MIQEYADACGVWKVDIDVDGLVGGAGLAAGATS